MDNQKKLAFVANTSWSIYNFRLQVARHLQSKGYTIYVIAPRDKHSEKLIAEGFHFINAPVKAYSNNPFSDLRYFLFLYQTYRKYRFEHIFHYTIKPNIYGSVAARMAGSTNTAVITGMGRMITLQSSVMRRTTEFLYKWGSSCADHIWFLNEEDKNDFESRKLLSVGNGTLLPSEGIDLDLYSPSGPRVKSQQTTFLFAGRLIREKGILEFLKAAERVLRHYPDVRFEIIGFLDPEDSSCIEAEVLFDYQDRAVIDFYGDRENVLPYLNRADCIVLPSYYGEGVSRVLLEAAAMEKVIITTNNRGCKEVVVDGHNGFLCKPKDAESLFNQMISVITLDQQARRVMGQNGRKLVKERFDVRKTCLIYQQHISIKEQIKKVNQELIPGRMH